MLISAARNVTRFSARNAGDETFYKPFMVDFAIQAAADDLIMRASLLPRVDQISTTIGAATFAAALGRFRPDRLADAFLTGSNVQVFLGNDLRPDAYQFAEGSRLYSFAQPTTATLQKLDFAAIIDRQIALPQTGQPMAIAFRDWNASTVTAATYPISDQAYTLNLRWFDFFTTWNLGTPLAVPVVTGGALASVGVTDGLIGFTVAPTITFQGGGGSGGAATATIDANGTINAINVTAGGAYTSAPDILINGIVSTDQTLNLPDDLMRQVLLFGAPAFLQHNDPEHAYATESGQKFEAYIQRLIGSAGGLGAGTVIANRRRR